jgi:hypothetical protein
MIKHAAWPTPPPPVCTVYWDQTSWDKFAERYRPEGYAGGIYDEEAYKAWLKSKPEETYACAFCDEEFVGSEAPFFIDGFPCCPHCYAQRAEEEELIEPEPESD